MSPHLQNRIISKWKYEMYRVILNDSKLIKNTKYTSEVFKIEERRLIAVVEEFNKTGCVIIQSKL